MSEIPETTAPADITAAVVASFDDCNDARLEEIATALVTHLHAFALEVGLSGEEWLTGIEPGTPLELPLAVNSGPLPLEPGSRYEWRLSIDGEGDEDWRLAFSVRLEEDTT